MRLHFLFGESTKELAGDVLAVANAWFGPSIGDNEPRSSSRPEAGRTMTRTGSRQ